MASYVHLVRHAEVENPQHRVYASLPGYRLSELGEGQALETARYLTARPIVAVWSSPLERSIQTAQSIAARHQLPVRVDNDLVEWRLTERWSGLKWNELEDRYPGELESYLENPTDLPFSEESLDELVSRMLGVIVALHDRYQHGDIVVVSHQDPIQAARLAAIGGDLRQLNHDKPQHAEVITLRPGQPWREELTWCPNPEERLLRLHPAEDVE